MNQLMSLFGVSKSSTNLFSTVTATPTISGCYYTSGQSRATVSVEVSWTGLSNGDDITVSLPGALNGTTRTITQNTGSNPPVVTPQVVAFEVATGFSATLTTSAPGAANDTDSITFSATCAPLTCGPNDLGGTVFNDYDADGIKDAGETNGASGVTVTAFDKNGATYTTVSDNLGRYCLTIPVANYPVRVEFTTIPAEFVGGFTTRLGTGNGSTVQFAAAPTQNVNLGVNNPADYCQLNPKVLIPCFFFGDPLATTGNPNNDAAAEPSMVRFNYDDDGVVGQNGFTVEKIAIASETGPIWGIAYKKATGHLFGATTIRRHAGLGPQGLGGIYVLNAKGPMGMGNVVDAWNVETQLGINVQNPGSPFGGSTNPVTSNTNRGLSANKLTPSRDTQAFSEVGKQGFGDIDISDDGNTLFFVNQYDKKLYGFDITNYDPTNSATRPTAANITVNTTIPDPGCTNGEWRPFATKYRRGVVYVGGVCNAITSNSLSDLRANVYAYNVAGNSWQQIFNFPLSYPKGSPNNGEKGWHPWTDDWNVLRNGSGSDIIYSVPMFTDIEFDIDGAMVLGFNDRSGMQTGRQNYRPDDSSTGLWTGFVGGDTLRAFFSNGTFVLENNAKAGPTTGYAENNNEGPGFGEFYEDNWRGQGHTEITVGGLAILPGSGEVASSSMDPHESSIWAAGVRFLSNDTGRRTRAVAVYSDSNVTGSTELGKSTGVGDIELRCEELSYLDIGNRIWMDANRNGIQDPGEMPVSGATVRLYRQGGADGTAGNSDDNTAIATAVTASDGTYHFTSVDDDNNGSPDTDANLTDSVGLVGGVGLLKNTNYVIRFDRGADYQFGGVLYGKRLSTGNAGGGTYGTLADLRDSDAASGNAYSIPGGNFPEIVVQHLVNGTPTNGTGEYGEVDHTMDTGFYLDYDFGDAPDPTFPTLLASNGARHIIVDGVRLGATIDAEDNGFPSANHDGDNNNNTNDEDGVVLPTLVIGQNATIQVTASVAGRLNGWIDFTGDGDWNDTGEKVFNDLAVVAGVNNLTISIPVGATSGNACSRFRFTTSTGMATNATGEAADGEVEDYLATIITPMNLGNLVWKDLDGDGVRDTVNPVEPGIDGVKVVLWRDNGDNTFNSATDTMVTMQNTSGGGGYNFTNLLPGNYFVQIDQSNFGAGVLSTCLSSPGNENGDATDNNDNGVDNPTPTVGGVVSVLIPLVAGSEPTNDGDGNNGNLTVDFGFYPPMNLGNLVWKDLDGDGIRDTVSPVEPGVDGVKVVLWRDNGDNTFNSATDTMVTMQNTSGGGSYNFTNLLPGNYFVQIDSTNFGAGVLSTCLSSPGNENGDTTDNNDNGVDNPTPTTGGVVSVLIPLVGQSEPTNDTDGNNGNLTVDFGFYPPMNLGNLVWKDLDADGVRDTVSPNEPGVDGVKVVLWRDNGDNTFNAGTDTMLTMQNTSGGGAYNFTGLVPGNYFVQIDSSNFGAGVLSTCLSSPNHDTGDATDNNDNGVDNPTPTTGGVVSVLIPLVGGTEPTNDGDGNNGNLTVDFGFYAPMNLGNLVWKDLDADGIRDTVSPVEPGVDGVKVVLWRDNGDNTFNSATDTMVTMQNTSGGGGYNFTNLLPGNYFVQIDSSNFGAGVLSTCLSSPGNDSGDGTDNNDNGIDNPTPTTGGVVSVLIPLISQDEPTNDGDGNNGNLTVDFGFYPPMNLGNLVWKDLDADGIRDTVSPVEPGVDGVKVVLWRDNGDNTFNSATDTMLTMQNTSGGGSYNFTNLLPGNYFVQIDSTNFGAGVLSTCLSSPGNENGDATDNNDNGVDNPTPATGGVVSVLIPLVGQSEPTNDTDGNNGNLTVDFGFYPPMNLGNLVWKDLDADGIRDTVSPVEPGVDGVKVVLWRDNGDNTFNAGTDTMVTMQNTSGGGSYNFQNLLPGNYFVQIDSTNFGAGVLSTCLSSPGNENGDATDNNDNGVDNPTPTTGGVVSVLIPLVGQSEPTNDGDGNNGNLTVDFGFYPPMNLGNLVWKDLDADGIRDTVSPVEPGVDGVKVVLWRDNGDNTFNAGTDTMVTMQNTSGGGAYNFTGLVPGTYFVQIDSTNFGAGVLSTCLSSPGADSGDTDNNDNGVDNPTPTTGGVVSTPVVLIGQSEPTDDGDGNNGNLTVDFGFYPPMNLGNLVWKDLDADGIRDTVSPNEPGVDGVKVVLWRDNGDNTFNSATDTMVTMQNTSGGGAYNFTNLLPGNYFVQIDSTNFGAGVLSTCLSSPGNENGDATDNNDNGVDNPTPATGGVVSVLIPLVGQSEPTNDGDGNNGNLTVDFGFYPPMNLGNLVWKDLDADGIRDTVSPVEPGVDGVKVVLWRDNGDNTFNAGTDTMVTMQNTSGGGSYNFQNLLPGNYFVQIDSSNFGAGVLSTCLSSPGNENGDATDNNDNGVDNPTPTTGGVVSVLIPLVGQSEPTNDGDGNNGNLTVDFGFYPPMNLGNLVWKDLDADGIRDTVSPVEPGVDGVKVVLWRDNGDNTFNAGTDTMVAMQNTSGGGTYNFTDLLPGNYFVQIDSSNFGAGVLSTCLSSPGNENGDATDNNDNGVDNPTPTTGGVVSVLISLIGQSEPTNDGDGNNGNLTVDFGFYPPMNLGNLVWKDLDADGIRDTVSPNEPGVDGVKVVLWRDNGDNTFNSGTDTMVTMQNTSGGGAYNFQNLVPGNYFVQIDQSNFGAGVLSTCLSSPGNDSGDATDNNDNGVDNPTPTTGGVVSVLISLIGQSEPTNDGDGNNGNLTVDFGFYPPMNLGNLIWKDLNGNGIRNTSPLEPGIDGVKVVLWRDNGDGTFSIATDTMLTMTNTAGGGIYSFTNLLPGTYFVEIPQSNFGPGQVLGDCLSSPGEDTSDTDDNDNGVDNTTPTIGGIVSTPIVLIGQSEPTNDGDGNNGNLTIDFGFAPAPDWAFGNNPNGIPGKVYEGDPCNGATGTYVLTMTNLGPTAANPGAVMTDVMPNGITAIAASGTGWSCTVGAAGPGQTVTCTSTAPLAVNAMTQIRITVGIGYNISGPVTNTASVAYPGDPGTNNNTASTTINVVNGIGAPGRPFENNGSSVLVYPIYTSNSSNPNEQNTRINLTNIHTQKSICVHLFFVDGSSCSIADSIVCLTPNQTTSFLASDLDPGTTGYLVAVAIDCTGCPTNFNFLIGDEYVKFASGHKGNVIAEGVAALPSLQACNNTSATAQINFDGVSYGRFGRTLAADNFGSRADGNDTMIVVNRIGGNLGTGAATLGTLFGILYDDAEQALSFNVAGTCQLRSSLTNNFPRVTPRFETFIPAGRTGWLKIFSQSDIALVGAMINYNANAASSAGAFNGAHNLHKLTLSSAGSYVIPVFPAQGCQ